MISGGDGESSAGVAQHDIDGTKWLVVVMW